MHGNQEFKSWFSICIFRIPSKLCGKILWKGKFWKINSLILNVFHILENTLCSFLPSRFEGLRKKWFLIPIILLKVYTDTKMNGKSKITFLCRGVYKIRNRDWGLAKIFSLFSPTFSPQNSPQRKNTLSAMNSISKSAALVLLLPPKVFYQKKKVGTTAHNAFCLRPF